MNHVNPLLQEMTSAYLERKKVRAINSVPVSSDLISRAIDMHLLCAVAKLLPYKDQPDAFDHLSKEELCKETFGKPALIEDNRAEIEEVIAYLESESASSALGQLKDNTKRVVLVIPEADLSDFKDNPNAKRYRIKSKALKDRSVFINGTAYEIGASQYLDQHTVGALGTGIFIDGNTILTAAHVLFPPFLDLKLKDIRFVVGYKVTSEEKMGSYVSVDKTNVYKADMSVFAEGKEGLEEIDYALSSFGEDWAKIKVVKENGTPNDSYEPITIGSVQANQHVYGLGHGLGLPLKMSYCGKVIDAAVKDNASIFKCTLDFYSGNSGSPIFDSASHALIGIHVRGQREFFFTDDNGTKKVKASVFSSTKGNIGEECQSIAALMPAV